MTAALRSLTYTIAMWVYSGLLLITGAAIGWAWAMATMGAC